MSLQNLFKSLGINHYFAYNRKCFIHLMPRIVCSKQCVGSITERSRFQWNNYRSCQGQHKQFLSEDHKVLLMTLTLILSDKTDLSDPQRRKCIRELSLIL